MTAADRALCARISGGDVAAGEDLLARDYAVADLLARAAGAAGDAAGSVVLAWEQLIGNVAAGSVTDGLRGALLDTVIAVLDDQDLLDTTDAGVPPAPVFLPLGDRWAGWWQDGPPTWPPGTPLTAGLAIEALRRMPIGARVLLVLRDAGGITATEAEPTVNVPDPRQTTLLDSARQVYVAAIDHLLAVPPPDPVATAPGAEETAGEAGPPSPDRAGAGIRASDVRCDVVVGLTGRWLDGDMSEQDRDAYEQHLLFCPPCLIQVAKTRAALAALRAAPAAVPGDDLRSRLARLIAAGA